jgi:prepilin-type N-terminal cleavage/methylation domain-containing protein
MAARIRAWLRREDGMTIPELLTAMAILSFVMTGILTVFVGGLNATTDMNERFQAQQAARLALTSMRNDIRGACTAAVGAVTGGSAGSLVALTEPGGANSDCSTATQVTWCADSTDHVSAPFTLYRNPGAGCAFNNGVSRATSLKTSLNVFSCSSGAGLNVRPQILVTLPVDANLASTARTYTLTDAITVRNAPVNTGC